MVTLWARVDKQQKGKECRGAKKQKKLLLQFNKEREKRETGVKNSGLVDEQQK